MRDAFINALAACARKDERIWLLTGDLGYSVLEKFQAEFPDRYLNAGVAEQNMTGIAAGLALSGKSVFTYSIANFPTLRCLEQIRNDVVYHHANVKIVSVGGGYAYGTQGYTHHGVEDYGILSLLPEIVVVAPGDPIETKIATELLADWEGPGYMRLGKAREPVVHNSDVRMRFGKAIRLRTGADSAIIATGGGLPIAAQAAEELSALGHEATLLSMPFLCPFDRDAVLECARNSRVVVTVEEHGPGGLGTKVGELLALNGLNTQLRIVRLEHRIIKEAGSRSYLCTQQGLTVEAVIRAALASHLICNVSVEQD